MMAYDCHLHAIAPNHMDIPLPLAKLAKKLGYKGICFVEYVQNFAKLKELELKFHQIAERVGIDILLGFEARNLRELSLLRKRRKEYDLFLVEGGNLKLNRKACETPEVDILTHPERGRADSGLDHVMAKLAAKNQVAIEINFREFMSKSGRERGKLIAYLRRNVMLAKKYGAPLIACSGAMSMWELRDPLCLVSLGIQLGLEIKDAKFTVFGQPKLIIERARHRRSKKWIMPGVEIV